MPDFTVLKSTDPLPSRYGMRLRIGNVSTASPDGEGSVISPGGLKCQGTSETGSIRTSETVSTSFNYVYKAST